MNEELNESSTPDLLLQLVNFEFDAAYIVTDGLQAHLAIRRICFRFVLRGQRNMQYLELQLGHAAIRLQNLELGAFPVQMRAFLNCHCVVVARDLLLLNRENETSLSLRIK